MLPFRTREQLLRTTIAELRQLLVDNGVDTRGLRLKEDFITAYIANMEDPIELIQVLIMNTGELSGELPSDFLAHSFHFAVTPEFHEVLKQPPDQIYSDEDSTYIFGPRYFFNEYELTGNLEAPRSMIVDADVANRSDFDTLFKESNGHLEGILWIGNTAAEYGDLYDIYVHRDMYGEIDSLLLDTGYFVREGEESEED